MLDKAARGRQHAQVLYVGFVVMSTRPLAVSGDAENVVDISTNADAIVMELHGSARWTPYYRGFVGRGRRHAPLTWKQVGASDALAHP